MPDPPPSRLARLRPRPSHRAFTRTDLLVVIGSVVLLGLTLLPVLAGAPRQRAAWASCCNNLRQIGRAVQMWASDHNDLDPWEVTAADGGTRRAPLSGNAWWQYAFMSNQLATPRILACPSDPFRTQVAEGWDTHPGGGFLNTTYRNNALSYFVGIDSTLSLPQSLVAGDRNIRCSTYNNGCTALPGGVSSAATLLRTGPGQWTNAVHGDNGNILLNDGSVWQMSSAAMSRSAHLFDDNGSVHLLLP